MYIVHKHIIFFERFEHANTITLIDTLDPICLIPSSITLATIYSSGLRKHLQNHPTIFMCSKYIYIYTVYEIYIYTLLHVASTHFIYFSIIFNPSDSHLFRSQGCGRRCHFHLIDQGPELRPRCFFCVCTIIMSTYIRM